VGGEMNFKSILVLLAFTCLAFAQVEKLVIDDFLVDTSPLIILINDQNSFPISQVGYTEDSGILGGQRDLILTVTGGSNNQVITSGVSTDSWYVATPNAAAGSAIVQYDGVDNSETVNPTGLGAIDLTAEQANSFHFRIQSDHPTQYTIGVYTPAGDSFYTLEVQGGNSIVQYEVSFSSFPQPVDFTRVGAIVLELRALTNVDAFIVGFATWGPEIVSPSPTPSVTPSTSPTATPTPSRTPEPVIDWYTFDDDDEGKSPCGDEPDRITYFLRDNDVVYYFYGFPDPVVELSSTNSASTLFSGFTVMIVVLLVNLF
jgi:hypothetical protein